MPDWSDMRAGSALYYAGRVLNSLIVLCVVPHKQKGVAP